jgi:hypothetical protein
MMVRRAACSGLIDNSFEFLDAKKLKHSAELSANPMRMCAALLYLYRSYAPASGSPLEFLCVDAASSSSRNEQIEGGSSKPGQTCAQITIGRSNIATGSRGGMRAPRGSAGNSVVGRFALAAPPYEMCQLFKLA